MATSLGSGGSKDRRLWWAGVAGPVGFIAAWMLSGAIAASELSPVADAISRLAAVGSEVRWVMTVGFVLFGVLVPTFGLAVRSSVNLPTAAALATTGIATLGVALTPLDRSQTIDQWHSVAAGVGYITLGAAPLFAWSQLRRQGRTLLAFGGVAAAVIAAVSLPLSLTDYSTGLFQRLGLTAVDLWIIGLAFSIRASQDG